MSFLANFTNLCNSVGKSPTAVCREIGLSNATYTSWKKTNRVPSDKTLQKIAVYFGVPKEKLVSEEVKIDLTASIHGRVRVALKEPSESDVLRLYRKASPEARAFIRGYLVKSAEVETPIVAAVDKTAMVGVEKNPVVAAEIHPRIRGEMKSKAKGGVKVKVRSGGKK